MEFQAYNAMLRTTVPSNMTWPNPSIDLATLSMATAAPLVPMMSDLTGLSTDGLINSTLYNTFSKTPQMVNASVNAKAIQANCGLLPNLTYTTITEGPLGLTVLNISASMSGIGEVYFAVKPPGGG